MDPARRAVVAFGVPVDAFDLRLYTMGLASLAITLLLAAALAVATTAPRRVFAWLGLNALLHLLLDATEIKFGNGVHLLAPFSWRMTSFELLPGESPVYLLLTIAGVLLVLWDIARRRDGAVGWERRPRSWVVAAALALAYLAAPLPFLSGIEASDSYSVKTLRETDERTGRRVSLDRVHFAASPAGGFLELWTGERVRATGLLPDHDATVSLHGTFLAPDVLRADVLVEQHRNRDWPSYLGLGLLALVFLRGIIPPMRPPLGVLALAALAPFAAPAAAAPKPAPPPFTVVEASIADMQRGDEPRRASRRARSSQQYLDAHRDSTRTGSTRSITVNPQRARRGRRARPRARGRARSAGRCTASRSRSRTTSTPPTCRRPAARWRSTASCRPTRRR